MDTVDLLVQHGCNINSIWQESTPIYLILCNRNIESAIQMLKQGAEITNLEGKYKVYANLCSWFYDDMYKSHILKTLRKYC